METLLQNVRYAFRRLAKSPGFTALAVVIMALGIGANTAVFSIVNAVLLKPQPYENIDELVDIYTSDENGANFVTSSVPDFFDIREQSDLFTDAIGHEAAVLSLIGDNGSEPVLAEYVTANYFSALGLRPAFGRAFTPEEDLPGASEPVVVLGYRNWENRFGADPNVIGRTVRLNGHVVTIVGVAPETYSGSLVGFVMDFWLPWGSGYVIDPDRVDQLEIRGRRGMFVKARLQDGVTPAQAQAGLDVLQQRLATTYPESNEGHLFSVHASRDVRIFPMVDRALYPVAGLLMAVVGVVLVIACSNLANLLLLRAAGRGREIAVRVAIGASRGRVMSQLLTESTLLGVLGGALGLVLAFWTARLIVSFRPPLPVPIALDLSLDWRVMTFAFALTIITGMLFGLTPAFRATRTDLVSSLKGQVTKISVGSRRFSLRNVLVVAQVGLSLLLLVGAGLFVRSLRNASSIDPGFETTNAAVATIDVGLASYSEDEGRAFYRDLVARVSMLPGVESVALAGRIPLGVQVQTREIHIEGYELPENVATLEVDHARVSGDYFATLSVPLTQGRAFTGTDVPESQLVAVVSEEMARRFWNAVDVVGQRFRLNSAGGQIIEIVGVAADTKVRTLGESPRPYLYTSINQEYVAGLSVVARTSGDPVLVPEAIRREIRALDPDVPVFEAKTMQDFLGVMFFAPRMGAMLLSALGGLALVLATIGMYGVIAFSVAQRTREVGIHMALGARPLQVLARIVGEGMSIVGVGALVGLGLAALSMRSVAAFLYGVSPYDAVSFGAATALLMFVALVASLVPARRAAAVNPVEALRHE